ncbi:MAG: ATP-binding domain-containing protein, partial [Myxococcota bacterium]
LRKLAAASEAVQNGERFRYKAAATVREALQDGLAVTGRPGEDWLQARNILNGVSQFKDLYQDSRAVRLFRATEALGVGLSGLFLRNGSYMGAVALVRKLLDRERLLGARRADSGCVLMNMHKSKGKEFDAVVLVEGAYAGRFFDEKYEQPPFPRSRRLLRVALTRARHVAVFVRPTDGRPLTD